MWACLLHVSFFLFGPSGHKKLPSNQAMIKAVEKDTRNIEKKYEKDRI